MLEYRRATEADIFAVLGVLDDAAAWLWRRAIRQWPEHFEADWIVSAIRERQTWLATLDEAIVGTFSLSWRDRVWPDATDNAGYLHRLAVPRSAAGTGLLLIDRAEALVSAAERQFLRLDCVATNEALRGYYERVGFHHRGDFDVHGGAGLLLFGEPTTSVTVSRYEKPVTG